MRWRQGVTISGAIVVCGVRADSLIRAGGDCTISSTVVRAPRATAHQQTSRRIGISKGISAGTSGARPLEHLSATRLRYVPLGWARPRPARGSYSCGPPGARAGAAQRCSCWGLATHRRSAADLGNSLGGRFRTVVETSWISRQFSETASCMGTSTSSTVTDVVAGSAAPIAAPPQPSGSREEARTALSSLATLNIFLV